MDYEKKPNEAREQDLSTKGIDMFFGEKERTLFESLGKELVHGMLKESFLLFRIDLKRTKVHEVYGESKKKVWLPPVEIFGRINVEATGPEYLSPGGIIRKGFGKLTAEVYNSHIEELEVHIRMGDFMYHKENFYEIIDDGSSNTSNEYAFGSDKIFFRRILGVEVNSDVFKAR